MTGSIVKVQLQAEVSRTHASRTEFEKDSVASKDMDSTEERNIERDYGYFKGDGGIVR